MLQSLCYKVGELNGVHTMLEIITIATDIALGSMAYRMARENKSVCEALDTRIKALELFVSKLRKEYDNVDLVN
jgi:hypothetical protein